MSVALCILCYWQRRVFVYLRNLQRHEIVEQVLAIKDLFKNRVSNVMFYGNGHGMCVLRLVSHSNPPWLSGDPWLTTAFSLTSIFRCQQNSVPEFGRDNDTSNWGDEDFLGTARTRSAESCEGLCCEFTAKGSWN